MGKGGGSVKIPQRKAGPEWQDIKKFFGGQENQYEAFTQKDPLLSMLYPGAQDYFNSPTSPLLSELQKQGLSQLQGGQSPLLQFLNQGAMGQDPLFQSLKQRAMTQDPLLQSMNQRAMTYDPSKLLGDLNLTVDNPDYLSGKVSAQELSNVVDQPTLAKFASMGNVGGNQAALQNFLNRDQYVNARQQQHLGAAQGVEGLNQADINAFRQYGLGVEGANQAFNQFGAGLNQAQDQFGLGVQGLNAQDLQNRFGIAGGVQGLSNQDIAQRFSIPQSVFQTAVAGYGGLTNPILGWLSDLFSSNQNAAAAQSVAGANQKSGQTGGILSTIGTVAMAAATAY